MFQCFPRDFEKDNNIESQSKGNENVRHEPCCEHMGNDGIWMDMDRYHDGEERNLELSPSIKFSQLLMKNQVF